MTAQVSLFLCGDVMTGRGIDQVLPHPGDPVLHEPVMDSALGYVALAEAVNGPIPRPLPFTAVWGAALPELQRVAPDLRLINLETAITTSHDYLRNKGIHYRMHPANIGCLTVAAIDACVLANNHVLDWGEAGLVETLAVLEAAGVGHVGAGRERVEAERPLVFDLPGKGRVLLFAWGHESSGVPSGWRAGERRPGVNLLPDLSERTLGVIAARVRALKQPGDIAVASLHWGPNWSHTIAEDQRRFARGLIDQAGIDVVHGHSSHHAQEIEVWHERLILYGCGDFINDYEGIGGYEAYRGDLALMYLVSLEAGSGRLRSLTMTPLQRRGFSLCRAAPDDAHWLAAQLSTVSACAVRVSVAADGRLVAQPGSSQS